MNIPLTYRTPHVSDPSRIRQRERSDVDLPGLSGAPSFEFAPTPLLFDEDRRG